MSHATNGHATLETAHTSTLEQLQGEMSELLKQLSTVDEMSAAERQRLQAQFELKSLEIRRKIVLAEHDSVVSGLPALREEIDSVNTLVKETQDRYKDALNRFSNLDERRRRLALEADQILRDCESVRLKMP